MTEPPIDLSLVLACYNEEPHFQESVRQIFETLDQTVFAYEIIFVDDCSRDRTRTLIDDLIEQNPGKRLRRIFHEKNVGRGGAVTDGFRVARGNIVGYIDIDLEVPARYIPACMLAILHGADVATAERIYRFYWSGTIRWILSHGYSILRRSILGLKLRDTETGYKFFRRERVLPLLDETQDRGWFWDTEIMAWSIWRGYQVIEVPCLFIRRFDKRSSVNPIPDTLDYLVKLWRFRWVAMRQRNPSILQ